MFFEKADKYHPHSPAFIPIRQDSTGRPDAVSEPEAGMDSDADHSAGDPCVTFAEIHSSFEKMPVFQYDHQDSRGKAACMSRMEIMKSQLCKFCADIRVSDGLVSRAQAKGLRQQDADNTWNMMMHELGKARQYQKLRGGRTSRLAAWMNSQEVLSNKSSQEDGGEQKPVFPVEACRPISASQGQFVIFQKGQGSDVLTFEVGLVLSLYRGSVSKSSISSRRMSLSKPLPTSAPVAAISRLKVCVLENIDGASWVATPFCDIVTVDVERICGELLADEEGVSGSKLFVSFSADAMKVLAGLQKGTLAFGSDGPKAKRAKNSDANVEEFAEFSIKSFSRGETGDARIECPGS